MCIRLAASVLIVLFWTLLSAGPMAAQEAGDVRETIRVTMSDGSVVVLGDGAPQGKNAPAICPDSGSTGSRVLKIEGAANTDSENDITYSVLWEVSNSTLLGTATSNRGDFPSVVEAGTTQFLLETTINNQNPITYTVDATAVEPGPARTYIRTMLSSLTLRDEECLFEILQRMYSLDVDSSPREVEIGIGGAGEPMSETTFFSRQVPEGTAVSLTTPESAFGEMFTEWQGTINSTDRTIEFVMESHVGVTAIYGDPPTADVGIVLAGVDGGSLGKRGTGASVDASGIVRLPPGADAVIRFMLSNFGPDIAHVFLSGSFSVAFSTITGMTFGGQPCGVSGGFFSCPLIEVAPGEDVPVNVDLTTGTTTGTDSGGLSAGVEPPVTDPNPENDHVNIVVEIADVGQIVGQKFFDADEDGTKDPDEQGINGIVIALIDDGFVVTRDTTHVEDLDGDGFINPFTEHGIFRFPGVPSGTYDVEEEIDDPWMSTTPETVSVDVAGGEVDTVRFGNVVVLDWGDLPDTFGTLGQSNGAAHAVQDDPQLGTLIDSENDGIPTVNADGDDIDGIGNDEDGITQITLNREGLVILDVTVSASNPDKKYYLTGWIDYNGSGEFDTAQEVAFSGSVTAGGSPYIISFLPPDGAILRYARLRLGTVKTPQGAPLDISPLGIWADGEVEDYRLILEDFGDAPDTIDPDRPDVPWGYPTRLIDDGARHIASGTYDDQPSLDFIPTIFLGDRIDSDFDGDPTTDADGDDRDRSYDEDGIEFREGFLELSVRPEPMARNGRRVLYGVTRGSEATIVPLASVEGHIDAWMDFNRDGDWEDAGEQIFDSEEVQTGPDFTPLTFSVPAGASEGPTFARFRFSVEGDLEFDGPARNGEVEDYLLHIVEPRVVSTTDDDGPGSLRALLAEANSIAGVDVIDMRSLGKRQAVIELQSPLPPISDPVVMLGGGTATLDGAAAGVGAEGLRMTGGGSTISGVAITGFDGHGIVLDSDGNAVLEGSVTANGGDGIRVLGAGNIVQGTVMVGNGGLGIDHGGDGQTPPDDPDLDGVPNAPTVSAAVATDSTRISGTLGAVPDRPFVIELFENNACDPSGFGEGAIPIGTVEVTTDASGAADFSFETDRLVSAGSRVTATAMDLVGGTSEFSACAVSTEAKRAESDVPEAFVVHPNYPNPFNPETTLRFDLPEPADVSVRIFDLLGRSVLTLPPRRTGAGSGRVLRLDASSLPSGVYVFRIRAVGSSREWADSGRMTLLK